MPGSDTQISTEKQIFFLPDSLPARPTVGRSHSHWESCPGCKVLQHKAGVGSPRQRELDTCPLAGQFEPPQQVWPAVACFPQCPWVPRHLCGSNAPGSCSRSRLIPESGEKQEQDTEGMMGRRELSILGQKEATKRSETYWTKP